MRISRPRFGRTNEYFRFDIYRRVLPFVRPYKRALFAAILAELALTGLALLSPWPLKVLIDSGIGDRELPGWVEGLFPFLESGERREIIFFAVAASLAIPLASRLVDVADDYLSARVNAGINLGFRTTLFNHFQRLSFRYHDQTTVGDSMYRLDHDGGQISTLVWTNLLYLLTSTLTFFGMLVIVFRLDWQIALLSLAAGPLLYLSVALSGRMFRDRAHRLKRMESAAQTVVQEVLSSLRVVKAFGTEEREQRRFERKSRAAMHAGVRLTLWEDLFGAGLGALTEINRALILLVGALHVYQGSLTIGELLVILAYVSQIHEPMQDIGHALTEMQSSLASAERTIEVLDVEPDVQERPDAKTLEPVLGAVACEHVTFSYSEGHPVLHDVSLKADAGEVVAVVGATGAGKTTLANLLARFYDPDTGRVLLDGHDVRELTLRTLRDSIAVVIQEPILFTDSVRANIAYGRPQATMDEIVAAARSANAHEFIERLPGGYASECGPRGVRLSGGERQRIAIARAFLKDAPVLLLDEPTSSVDSRTELVILDALDELMVGRTTFIIAHRLSTIRRADQILVLDHGRIVERGTHDELIERNGLYAEFFRIQSTGLRSRRRVQA